MINSTKQTRSLVDPPLPPLLLEDDLLAARNERHRTMLIKEKKVRRRKVELLLRNGYERRNLKNWSTAHVTHNNLSKRRKRSEENQNKTDLKATFRALWTIH